MPGSTESGRIAAANAISDIYAMGALPVTAMNLVFFPACSMPGEVLREILAGGQSVLQEAGVCLVGGHLGGNILLNAF